MSELWKEVINTANILFVFFCCFFRSVPLQWFSSVSTPETMSCAISAAFWGNIFSSLNAVTLFVHILSPFILSLFLLTLLQRHWLQWAVQPQSFLIFKHLAIKILKWLIEKHYNGFKALLMPHVLPFFFWNYTNTWQQLWQVSVIQTRYFGPWLGCGRDTNYCDLWFDAQALMSKKFNKSAMIGRDTVPTQWSTSWLSRTSVQWVYKANPV